MEAGTHKEIALTRAIVVFLAVAVLIVIAGFTVGELYFWGKHAEENPVDLDIKYMTELVAKSPDDKNLVELGWLYYRKGDYQRAVEVLSRAVKLNRLNPAAHFNLGLTYQEIKLLDKAEAEFIKTLELDPESKYAYFALGKLYFSQEKWDEAAEQFKLASQKDPVSVENFFWLGQAYEKQGFRKEALAAYRKALDRVPNYTQAREAYYRLKQ